MTPLVPKHSRASGMTLVELMVTVGVLGMVVIAMATIVISSNRMQSRTARRANVQADARQTLSIMSTELRQAGADPSNPPAGIVGIVSGDSVSIRVRSDLNGNGTIQTAEPSEDVTYAYVPASKTITRNPGAGASALMTHVQTMRLTYFASDGSAITALPLNATDAARVFTVGLTMTAEDRDSRPLTLTTRIHLRNR
jgi:type IV pilus assembly protein PilW